MSNDLIKRAKALDKMGDRNISEKLTHEEAQNIVSVWGAYLEHSGIIRYLFDFNIPKSFLPYPIEILQGALVKMEKFYHSQRQYDRVKLLQETEMLLVQYTADKKAIEKSASNFSKSEWQDSFIKKLDDYQKTQAENGYLVDKKLWKMSKSRMEKLQED